MCGVFEGSGEKRDLGGVSLLTGPMLLADGQG
jgi:hypothetical protein